MAPEAAANAEGHEEVRVAPRGSSPPWTPPGRRRPRRPEQASGASPARARGCCEPPAAARSTFVTDVELKPSPGPSARDCGEPSTGAHATPMMARAPRGVQHRERRRTERRPGDPITIADRRPPCRRSAHARGARARHAPNVAGVADEQSAVPSLMAVGRIVVARRPREAAARRREPAAKKTHRRLARLAIAAPRCRVAWWPPR